MVSNRRTWVLAAVFCVAVLLTACSVQYKFNGASINYDQIKTIQISDFPLRTALVWAPMRSIFNNQIQDIYANQTRLRQVKRKGFAVERRDCGL